MYVKSVYSFFLEKWTYIGMYRMTVTEKRKSPKFVRMPTLVHQLQVAWTCYLIITDSWVPQAHNDCAIFKNYFYRSIHCLGSGAGHSASMLDLLMYFPNDKAKATKYFWELIKNKGILIRTLDSLPGFWHLALSLYACLLGLIFTHYFPYGTIMLAYRIRPRHCSEFLKKFFGKWKSADYALPNTPRLILETNSIQSQCYVLCSIANLPCLLVLEINSLAHYLVDILKDVYCVCTLHERDP